MSQCTTVIVTDNQDKFDVSAGLSSRRREILPGLVLCNEKLTAMLADEGVRTAIARAGKGSTCDWWDELLTVNSIKPLGGTSGAGAVEGTVATASTSAKGLKGTRICSTPVPPQNATTLFCQAPTTSGQSLDDNKSAREKLEQYDEEDEITSAPKVLRKTDWLAVAHLFFTSRRYACIAGQQRWVR